MKVFDAHHHICHEKLDSYDDRGVAEMFYAARETWDKQKELFNKWMRKMVMRSRLLMHLF
ncbi:MAG: hypothetical protein WBA39_11820 [Rivularia sp. (in: cyanobacteria)]